MSNVVSWTSKEVAKWLEENNFSQYKDLLCEQHRIDGQVLLSLTENDLRQPPIQLSVLGDIKRLVFSISQLQQQNPSLPGYIHPSNGSISPGMSHYGVYSRDQRSDSIDSGSGDDVVFFGTPQGHRRPRPSKNLDPELWKTFLSFIYAFSVFLITSFVMVVVHDRVPDMQKYPPLPDLFLDNVPYISWAFLASEIIAVTFGVIWSIILFFHKHRFILLRRMFSLTGTVYLLRCVCMLITSLSVPGVHLQCEGKIYGDMWTKLRRTIEIWMGMGMTLSGVRTCGDYMFSGHTVLITLLNFFITEYTPRKHNYYLHMMTWVANMFGLFFILAAHEHYSIDVFIAFYISSRLFLYYHVLANNRSLMSRDKKRRRVWFPLFSFFESKCDGIVPNEFEWPLPSLKSVMQFMNKKKIKKN